MYKFFCTRFIAYYIYGNRSLLKTKIYLIFVALQQQKKLC